MPPTPNLPTSFAEDAAGGLAAIGRPLTKYWPTVLACVLLGGATATVYSKATPRIYQAQSTLEMAPKAAQPLGEHDNANLEIGVSSFWDAHEYYETQYKVLTSDRMLGIVARDVGLLHDPNYVVSGQPPAVVDAEVAAKLRGQVTIEPVKATRLFLIKVEDTNPDRAQRICNALASEFVDQNLENAISSSSESVRWLNGQVDHIQQELYANENALHKFKEDNDLPSTSFNEASNTFRAEMDAFDSALTQTRTKKQGILARQAALTSYLASDNPAEVPISDLLNNGFLSGLRTQYLEAVRQRDGLLAEGKGENHPLVKAAGDRVGQMKSALVTEVRNIKGAVDNDLAILNREEAGLSALLEASRKKAVDLNMKEIEYHRLDRARAENEKLFELLVSRMKEADIARMMRVNNIRVIDVAIAPKVAIRPRTLVNVGVGILIGLVFGVGLAFAREQLDNSLKTPADLEQKLGITFLGLLPELDESKEDKRRGSGRRRKTERKLPVELVVHEHPLSGIAEAARSIRTNLLFMSPDKPYRRLLVTSAAPAEGKTTMACSIAIALAQGGQRVCIVDCDLRRPRIHRVFDRAGDMGVTNVIVGDASIDDIAKPTCVENLWSIPAGPIPPNPADLLHSERFKKFLNDLSERFDRVVLDSPPIVPVTDSAIISTLVDGTVFVIRAFRTTRNMVRQGLRALRDVDSPLVGAVLNAVNLDRREYSYYYHYYYYGRDGYRYEPADVTESEGSPPPPN